MRKFGSEYCPNRSGWKENSLGRKYNPDRNGWKETNEFILDQEKDNFQCKHEAQATLEKISAEAAAPFIKQLDDIVSGVLSVVEFPASLSSKERLIIHNLSELRNLSHTSIGKKMDRRIVVSVVPRVPGRELLLATDKGNRLTVVAILASKPELINEEDKGTGWTPIIHSSYRGHINVVKELLKWPGCNVDKMTRAGDTALFLAIIGKHLEIAKELLSHGCATHGYDGAGETVLTRAVFINSIPFVELLLSYNCNVNITNRSGNTALILAIIWDRLPIFELLLANNCDLDIKNKDGDTALGIAITKQNPSIVKILLNRGCSTNINNGNNGRYMNPYQPLHTAIQLNHTEIVTLLLNHGCDKDIMDGTGQTPLIMAIKMRLFDIAELLLNRGCLTNTKSGNGDSPLSLATGLYNNIAIVTMLLNLNCEKDMVCKDGNTALLLAALHNRIPTFQLLFNRGCALDVQNKSSESALFVFAVKHRNVAMTRMLLVAGASLDLKYISTGAVDGKGEDILETAKKSVRKVNGQEIVILIAKETTWRRRRHWVMFSSMYKASLLTLPYGISAMEKALSMNEITRFVAKWL